MMESGLSIRFTGMPRAPMRRRKSMGLRKFSQPQPRSAFEPPERLLRHLGRERVLACELAQRDRKARAAKIARDRAAGVIDRQDRIIRAVREKDARLSNGVQRKQEPGRERHHMRE